MPPEEFEHKLSIPELIQRCSCNFYAAVRPQGVDGWSMSLALVELHKKMQAHLKKTQHGLGGTSG